MRGARTGDNPAPHLLAALDQASGVVVGQRRVSDKSNEIPALRDLLAPMDLDGALITADAMRTRRGTAEWIRSRGAHYLLTVKGMPAGPETGAGGPALEGRPGRLERRHRPRAAGAAHRPGRRGPRVDRLPRRRPGGADPPHHNHREAREHGRERQGQEEDHRGGPPDLLPSHGPGPARGRRLLGPRPLGHGEPAPLGARRRHGRGPPPAAHRQRTPDHGRPAQPRHQPHPPGPRRHSPHRRHHQGHGQTPPTSHRPDHPTNHLNRLCRPPAFLVRLAA